MTATWIDGPAPETKPRIEKNDDFGWFSWKCSSPGIVALGSSPKDAYHQWSIIYAFTIYPLSMHPVKNVSCH